MPVIFYVALGGALGSSLRYLTGQWTQARWGANFPWGTLSVNLLGSLLLGLLISLSAQGRVPPVWTAALGAGVLGGFTTFSSFSVESIQLFERDPLQLLLNLLLQLGGGLSCAALGMWLGRSLG